MLDKLNSIQKLFIKQSFELAEIFSFETRNKYRISDEAGQPIGFIAEQQKGVWGFILRQFLGHWRTFDLHFYDTNRKEVMVAHHPFRWYFQRLEVLGVDGRRFGAIEKYFAFFSKKFKVEDGRGQIILEVSSPIWRIWTFPFMWQGFERARVAKKWSGVGYEIFTDRDNFLVEYKDAKLTTEERAVILAASVYIDLMYFERKSSGGLGSIIGD